MLVMVEKGIYQAQSQIKTKTFHFLSLNRDPCVTTFKCCSLNVVHACSIVVHKWIWMLGYISPLFLCFFQWSLFLFLNIIFTLASNIYIPLCLCNLIAHHEWLITQADIKWNAGFITQTALGNLIIHGSAARIF